jgi:alkaline phosphatase D
MLSCVENHKLSRRRFLAYSSQFLVPTYLSLYRQPGQVPPSEYPFTLGLASGDPEPDGVVLWTRLAPDPMNGGGMRPERVEVEWQIASDERMQRVVARGRTMAAPEFGHSIHVEVRGLEAGRWYWYRFRTGSHESPVGRTRTAPDPSQRLSQLSFAFASCQRYDIGFYTAYRHMAEEEIELVVFLGDYIYEDGISENRPRRHDGPEPTTLTAYRNRHALYRTDPDLQRAHALFPWIITWDDHEVENNYANDISEDNVPRPQFLERRAAAYQAYYEHMPLRRSSMPKGPSMRLYRRLVFGDLASFSVLDTRQYRSDQPCGDGKQIDCAAAAAPSQTMLGRTQERWLLDGLAGSRSRWNIIANQVNMMPIDYMAGSPVEFSMDKWAGYEVERERILKFLYDRRISNPIVITGDIHENWAGDLKLNRRDPQSPTVATEFVGTSISSGGDGSDMDPAIQPALADNPHIVFFNDQRGYVRCTVTPKTWQSDFRVLEYVSRQGSPITTRASFVVEAGRPGVQRS